MNLLAFIGIPDCAVYGCGSPGIVKIEIEGENGAVWANLCVGCMGEIRSCLGRLSKAAHEDVPLLDKDVEGQQLEPLP